MARFDIIDKFPPDIGETNGLKETILKIIKPFKIQIYLVDFISIILASPFLIIPVFNHPFKIYYPKINAHNWYLSVLNELSYSSQKIFKIYMKTFNITFIKSNFEQILDNYDTNIFTARIVRFYISNYEWKNELQYLYPDIKIFNNNFTLNDAIKWYSNIIINLKPIETIEFIYHMN